MPRSKQRSTGPVPMVVTREDRLAEALAGDFVVLEATEGGKADRAGSPSSSPMEVLVNLDGGEEDNQFAIGDVAGDGAVHGKKVLTQKLRAALSRSGPRGTRKPRGGRGRA